MTFQFSNVSKDRLSKVHPKLRQVFERAIELSTIDFRIQETLRTAEAQRANMKKGASQTMNSYHIPRNGESFARAVDVVALVPVNGKSTVSWAENDYYRIYDAVRLASIELDVPLTYGGAWNQGAMKDYPVVEGDGATVKSAVLRYVASKRAVKQKPFLDIGHVQIEV